jgi:hypothetical protein
MPPPPRLPVVALAHLRPGLRRGPLVPAPARGRPGFSTQRLPTGPAPGHVGQYRQADERGPEKAAGAVEALAAMLLSYYPARPRAERAG